MHAAVLTEFGKPPRYQVFAEPVVHEGEVLVHVRAAGLHPLVKAMASGKHYASGKELPEVPGVDGIGTLDNGQRVYFVFVRKPWGTIAERAPAQRAMCIPVPDGISDVDAAAVANPGISAWMSLRHRGALEAGDSVVILGATGVAGQLAIQIARLHGARRIVAVGRNVEALAGADVDRVIGLNDPEDAIKEAFAEEAAAGINIVSDYIWGCPAEMLMEALAKQFNRTKTICTRWVEVGDMAGKTITLAGGTLRSVDLRLMGSGYGSNSMEKIQATVPALFQDVARGAIKVSAVGVPLKEVEAAWSKSDAKSRIVLTI